jgi:hypothetical protein
LKDCSQYVVLINNKLQINKLAPMPTKDTPAIKVVINVVFTDPKDNQSYILN